MESIKFDVQIPLTINQELLDELDQRVKEQKQIYNSRSHFIRSAIIQKLRGNNERH